MEMNEHIIYKGEDGYLYIYDPDSGRIWELTCGNYRGEPGHPLPGNVEGIGNMTMLGVFKLSD